jgi:hypothetical protein
MADVFLDRDEVHVVLGALERVGALRGDLVIPIAHVRAARVVDDPFPEVRGVRSPGTGWPRGIALGTWRSRRHGRTFAAAYRGASPALVIELDGERYARVVVSTDDAARIAAALSAPAGSSPDRR